MFIQNGTTPLVYASGNGHVEAVNLLLEKGALVNKVQYCNVNTSLCCCWFMILSTIAKYAYWAVVKSDSRPSVIKIRARLSSYE